MENVQLISFSKITLPHKDGLPSAALVSVAQTLLNRTSQCTSCGGENCGDTCKSGDGCSGKSSNEQHPQEFQKPEDNIMAEIVFKGGRKTIVCNRNKVPAALGDIVIVEADHGIDIGRVSAVGRIAEHVLMSHHNGELPNFSIVRIAESEDIEALKDNRRSETEIIFQTRNSVKEYGLEMKISDAEWQFDRSKLTIFFTSPQRIDFRDLVKDIARTYRARIELRQIPARDEAKRLGGIGPCGLELCCSAFLTEFGQITVEHAKAQLLPANIGKLSGLCGRLKCCLLYEIDNYVVALQNYPPLDSIIEIKSGQARMIKIDIFKDTVTIFTESDHTYQTLTLEEINQLRREGKIRYS